MVVVDKEKLIIEISGNFNKNKIYNSYSVHYCGPDKRKDFNAEFCSSINISSELRSLDFGYYLIYKRVHGEPHYYSVTNYSFDKLENRLHRIANQFAKLYLRHVVPDTLKYSVEIVDVSNYNHHK